KIRKREGRLKTASLPASLRRRLPLSRLEIGANFSNRSKIIDFLCDGWLFDPLHLKHEFENLLLELRIKSPVLSKSGQNQIINLGGDILLDLHEPRENRDRAGAVLPDIKQTLERPLDHLLQQERVGVKKILPHHDGSRRLDEVVLFDEGDELARTGFLRFEVKRRRKIRRVNRTAL